MDPAGIAGNPLETIFNYIENHRVAFINDLAQAVAMPSVSAIPDYRKDVCHMAHWIEQRLKEFGAEVVMGDLGLQTLRSGLRLPMPPLIMATIGRDESKRTILGYCHYDVQPADEREGWNTPPFEMVQREGMVYGRGVSHDKGSVMAWLHVLEAYKALGISMPVNLRLLFEGLENGSKPFLLKDPTAKEFLRPVDYVAITDEVWLEKDVPTIIHGARGFVGFSVEVKAFHHDLNSGHGGAVYQPLPDLFYILGNLMDVKGKIFASDFYDDVASHKRGDSARYQNVTFEPEDYRLEIGAKELLMQPDKDQLLNQMWRFPSLSMEGVEGAYAGEGRKSVIPSQVIGKFSVRFVPDQTADGVIKSITNFIEDLWKQRKSPNDMKIVVEPEVSEYWFGDPVNDPHFAAAKRASDRVYADLKPTEFTSTGRSAAMAVTLGELTGNKSVIILPLGSGDDRWNGQNEKLNLRNYIDGTKVFVAYMEEVSRLPDWTIRDTSTSGMKLHFEVGVRSSSLQAAVRVKRSAASPTQVLKATSDASLRDSVFSTTSVDSLDLVRRRSRSLPGPSLRNPDQGQNSPNDSSVTGLAGFLRRFKTDAKNPGASKKSAIHSSPFTKGHSPKKTSIFPKRKSTSPKKGGTRYSHLPQRRWHSANTKRK